MLVHTGQNYDHALNEVFFDDLALRAPDHYLGVDTVSLGRVLGGVLSAIEQVLAEERPDALLVLGDTNCCIAAVMAKRMRMPVYHMEAGNRCFDENVPEETNRRLVDHVADFNLAYTEHARRNLLAEGLHPRRILLTGSPMREVLEHYRPQIDASDGARPARAERRAATSWSARTARRTSTPRTGCDRLLDCLRGGPRRVAAAGGGVHPPAHPQAAGGAGSRSGTLDGIAFHEPFGFLDYVHLQSTGPVHPLRQRHDQRGVRDPRLPGGHAARLDRAPGGARRRLDHHDRPGPGGGGGGGGRGGRPGRGRRRCPARPTTGSRDTSRRVVDFILSTSAATTTGPASGRSLPLTPALAPAGVPA